jgi:hypothetical protein
MKCRMFIAAGVVSLALPALASAQGSGVGVSVQGAAGADVRAGGNNQSIALGLAPGRRLELLISAERLHLPMQSEGTGVTRGGTARFISGEIRVMPFTAGRVRPYLLASVGRGESRPTVNAQFPDPVTNTTWMLFGGAGATLDLTDHVGLFADVRAGIQSERDTIALRTPVRAGIALRF